MTVKKATTSDFISAVSTALANGDDIKVSFDFSAIKNWWEKKAFNNPYAPPQAEEDEEEEKRKKFPLLPLAGAGALGYGAYKLPNVFGGSQQQVDTFERATKGYNPQAFAGSFDAAKNEYINKGLPENMTELQYYQSVLAPAAQLDIGGKSVGDALVAIRGNKKLMKFLEDKEVISPGYGLTDRASMFGNSGAGHYRQFRQGSVPAYMHMMTAHHKGKQVPYSMLSDTELKDALSYSVGPESSTASITPDLLKKDSPLSYPEWIERRLQKHLASKVPSSGTPWELDTRFLPEEEQQELMKSWFASMTPEEQKYRLQIEDLPEKYITQTSNYLPKAQQVTGIRKKLQQAAPYVAGGAGLYALYKLVNYLRDRVGDDEEEEQQEEAEQSLAKAAGTSFDNPWAQAGLLSLLGGVGGAGIGGILNALKGESIGRGAVTGGLTGLGAGAGIVPGMVGGAGVQEAGLLPSSVPREGSNPFNWPNMRWHATVGRHGLDAEDGFQFPHSLGDGFLALGGGAAGGAGLGGVGGYQLAQLLMGDKDKDKDKDKASTEKQAADRGLPGLVSSIGKTFQKAVKAPVQGTKNIKSNLVSEIGASPDRSLFPQVVEYMGTGHRNPISGKPQLPLMPRTRGTALTDTAKAIVMPRIPKALGGRATGALVTGGLLSSQVAPAVTGAADVYRNPEKYISGEDVFDAAAQVVPTGGQPTGGKPASWVGDIARDFATNYGTDLTKAKLSGLLSGGDTPYYPYQSRVDAAIGNTMFQYLNNEARNRGAQAAQNAPLITAATPLKGIGPSMLTGSVIRSLGDSVPQEALTLGQAMTKNIPSAYEGVEDPTEILNDLRQSLLLKRMNEARGAVPEGMSLEKDRLLDFLSTRRDALEGPSRDAYQKFINEYTGK
jgi:hypothetical protein